MLSRGARFLGQYVASQPTQLLESILRVSSAACGTYESTELGTPVSQACTYGGWLASRRFAATAAPKPSSAPATPVPAQEGLQIDPTAVQRLKDLAKERGGKPTLLRIEVEGGGCSGFQYKFSLDSNTAPTDIVFEKDGERVIVDNVSLEFLQGAKVEFEDSLMRSSFVISANPNSEASCGCGSSFTAKMKK